MIVKNVKFERKFLKHTNYKNNFHVYTEMETIPDKPCSEIPESVIELLYRIFSETQKQGKD